MDLISLQNRDYILFVCILGLALAALWGVFVFKKRGRSARSGVALVLILLGVCATIPFLESFSYVTGPWLKLAAIFNCFFAVLLVLAFFVVHSKERERRQAVESSEQQYRAMFEKNLAIKMIVDPDTGKIAAINEAACRFYGYQPEQAAELAVFDLLPYTRQEALDLMGDIVRCGGRPVETRHRLNSGEWRDVEMHASPLQHQGKTMLFAIVNDVSERKRVERENQTIQAQLAHSAKLASIGTLAAGVAHEINNPLTILKGYSEILARRLSEVEPEGEALKIRDKMSEGIDRISAIVGSLRTYARSDTEHVEAVELNKVITDTLTFVQQVARKANVEILQQLSAQNPSVRGNIGKIQQVLINLITNACDALESRPSDRQIIIETVVEGEGTTLYVSDNGCGIKKSHLRQVFDPFFTTKPVGKGTGLGLSISRSIIESLGGSFQVSSKEGEGCTFRIGFCLMDSMKTSASEEKKGEERPCLPKFGSEVLIVDDEPDLRAILHDYLQGTGLVVTDVPCAGPALALMKEKRFDLMIIDLQLPDFNGLELLKEARATALQAHTKFIIITGGIITAYTHDERAYIRSEAHGYLLKPFDRSQILGMVSSLIPA